MHETNFKNGVRLENLKGNSGLLSIDNNGIILLDTSVAAISAGLDSRTTANTNSINTLFSTYANSTTVAAISAGLTTINTQQTNSLNTLFSTYANSTTVAAISAALQSQLNNVSSAFTISGGNGITTSVSGSVWTVGLANGLQGRVACDSVNMVYTISHTTIDTTSSFPIVSLDVPTSGSDIFVQGIFNRTPTSFQVILSGKPSSSYGILWHIGGIASISSNIDTRLSTLEALETAEGLALFTFNAAEMDNPITSDWIVNALAPNTTHPSNTGIITRAFDPVTEEGIGISIDIPEGSSNIRFTFISCGATSGGGGVVPKIYSRYLRNNAAISSWSAGTTGGVITMPTSTAFRTDEFNFSTSTLGVSAGDIAFFEVTRSATNSLDTLSVDWMLLKIKIKVT